MRKYLNLCSMKQNQFETYFVSGSASKHQEICAYIPGLRQLHIKDVPELQSLDIKEIIEAKIKYVIDYLKHHTPEDFDAKQSLLITEDTGLYLEALNGFPGPLIKFMLEKVGGRGIFNICNCFDNDKASAISVFGVYSGYYDEIRLYDYEVKGKIVYPKGDHGFGWDSIFMPANLSRTFAELQTIHEKNEHSMRYMAMRKMLSDHFFKNINMEEQK